MEVFGHRGACGYLPENTMESLELAFELGADGIEFDVVITKDGHPVICHDRDLSVVTNISEKAFLSSTVDELNLADIKQLRAIERYPEGRPESHQHSGRYAIPTLSEVFQNRAFDTRHLIVELKYGQEFFEQGLNVAKATADALLASDVFERGTQITIESFDYQTLLRAKDLLGEIVSYVFLVAPDTLPQGEIEVSDDFLTQIARDFDGLSVAIPMVLQSDLVSRSHALEMPIYAYTARVETAEGDVRGWFERLIATEVDAIFADQPDQLIKVRDDI